MREKPRVVAEGEQLLAESSPCVRYGGLTGGLVESAVSRARTVNSGHGFLASVLWGAALHLSPKTSDLLRAWAGVTGRCRYNQCGRARYQRLLNAHDCTHHLRARRPVEGDNPYNRTLSHHLHYVTSPAFLIAFLQFIDDLDSVLTGGQITSEYYPLLVFERVHVPNIKMVTRHAWSAHSLILSFLCSDPDRQPQPRR